MDHQVAPTAPVGSEASTPETPNSRKRGGQPQHPDRIKVSAAAVQRLAAWNVQLAERLRGIKLTRSDLVNFIILNHPEALTAVELNELQARHFDEVKFVLWAVEEKKAAQARGDDITIAEIMAQNRPGVMDAPRSRSRKSDSAKISENTEKKAQKQSHTIEKDTLISVENSAE